MLDREPRLIKLSRATVIERCFDALARASALIVWVTDPDGKVIEDSPSWREFSGQSREQWLGCGWLNAVHPDDRETAARVWTEAVAGRTRYETTYRLCHRSGEWRWTTARGYPVVNDAGEVDCWVGLNDDITERRAATQRLEASEVQFRTLAETTSNLIWIGDARGRVYYWNPAWFEYTGLRLEDSLGLDSARLVRPDLRDEVLAHWTEAVDRGSSFDMEVPVRNRFGHYESFLVKARPIRNSAGEILRWCGVMTNVNGLRELADTLRRERQNRERFVGSLVHDLKNAFGTGKVAMSVVLDQTTSGSEREAYEALVLRSFQRASRMVEDLLDANAVGAGHAFPLKSTEAFSLDSCLADVARATSRAAHVPIDVAVPPGLVVRWSLVDTVRIVENLLSNAVKYGDKASPITIGAALENDRVTWWVHNWGEPLPVADQTELFTFLNRAQSARDGGEEGWGIGLTLVKGLVEAHGGTVEVESARESGTRFVMRMPLAVTPAG